MMQLLDIVRNPDKFLGAAVEAHGVLVVDMTQAVLAPSKEFEQHQGQSLLILSVELEPKLLLSVPGMGGSTVEYLALATIWGTIVRSPQAPYPAAITDLRRVRLDLDGDIYDLRF